MDATEFFERTVPPDEVDRGAEQPGNHVNDVRRIAECRGGMREQEPDAQRFGSYQPWGLNE
jgi:hypothetical protein